MFLSYITKIQKPVFFINVAFDFISHGRDTKNKTLGLSKRLELNNAQRIIKNSKVVACSALTGRGQLIWIAYSGQLLGAADPRVWNLVNTAQVIWKLSVHNTTH